MISSSDNSYKLTDGTYELKSVIDRKTVEAKASYSEKMNSIFGYPFCERCTKNTCKGIERSHIMSVDFCQKNGMAEFAYDEDNLEQLGRSCHNDIERWSFRKRALWFQMRLEGKSYMNFLIKWVTEGGEY